MSTSLFTAAKAENMYAPTWPGLRPAYLFPSRAIQEPPFPLNAPNAAYFYRARNAIYHLFRALDFRQGSVVLVPAYHSGNEVWAIRAAGASVVFYPINRSLEPDLDALVRLCESRNPRALFVIHFLGWPQPMKELTSLCEKRGMILIEDCALSLLSETQGRPLGTFGDYAIFCLYKTVPVPNGGILVQNRSVLEGLASLALNPCGIPSVAGRSAELMLEWIRSQWGSLGKALSRTKRGAGRALSTLHIRRVPVGDIGFDLADVNLAMSSLSHVLLKRFDFEAIRLRRRQNYLLLRQKLDGRVAFLRAELGNGVCPLSFPILVPDKRSAARALLQRGIGAVEFWNYGDSEAQRLSFEDVQFLRDHVLELPIHQDITPEQVEYIAEEVLRLKLNF